MWISWMLFSLRGRMRRRDWWVGSILTGLAQLVGGAIIYAKSYPGMPAEAFSSAAEPPAATALGLLMLWPALALAVKRSHDRDSSGWAAAAIIVGVTAASYAAGVLPPTLGWAASGLTLAGLAGLLWLIVTLGGLQGTAGDNRFGPAVKV